MVLAAQRVIFIFDFGRSLVGLAKSLAKTCPQRVPASLKVRATFRRTLISSLFAHWWALQNGSATTCTSNYHPFAAF